MKNAAFSIEELFRFLDAGVSAFHSTAAASAILEAEGYVNCPESAAWELAPGGKYYTTRNGSAVLAWRMPKGELTGWHAAASHSDSPTWRIKTLDGADHGFARAEVEGYGGMLMSTWFDRPLSVAGRLLVRTADGVESRLVHPERALACIPNLCIHFNREANTGLNYPIVQTAEEGGEYYLYRDIDGSSNKNGTVFLDWQCSSNFTSQNNLVYGHNMKTGRMFAPIVKYRDQSFYDAHPYMYLYTPNQLYKVNLFAGMVTPHDSDVYAYELSSDYIKECIANSTFKSNVGTPTGNILTLSTCAYDFDNARYVVMGELVPIDWPSSGN